MQINNLRIKACHSLNAASLSVSLMLAVVCCASNSCSHIGEGKASAVKLILDTDLGPDYDDVGAFALMYALEEQGKVDVLATISCNRDERVVPCIKILNAWYGHADMPTGAPEEGYSSVSEAPSMTCWQEDLHWPDSLCINYGHFPGCAGARAAGAETENAVKLYRKILSRQADRSVTICSIGFYSNLAALLTSGPDGNSPLPGRELVARKVVRLVSMAGAFPGGEEFNLKLYLPAARLVCSEWPGDVIFSGFEIGERVWTGRRLIEEAARYEGECSGNPVVDAYAGSLKYGELESGHNSWDGTAVLIAICGADPYFELCRGRITFAEDSTGSNGWQEDPQGPHSYVRFKLSPDRVAAAIDSITLSHSKFAYLKQ